MHLRVHSRPACKPSLHDALWVSSKRLGNSSPEHCQIVGSLELVDMPCFFRQDQGQHSGVQSVLLDIYHIRHLLQQIQSLHKCPHSGLVTHGCATLMLCITCIHSFVAAVNPKWRQEFQPFGKTGTGMPPYCCLPVHQQLVESEQELQMQRAAAIIHQELLFTRHYCSPFIFMLSQCMRRSNMGRRRQGARMSSLTTAVIRGAHERGRDVHAAAWTSGSKRVYLIRRPYAVIHDGVDVAANCVQLQHQRCRLPICHFLHSRT